MAYLKRPAFTRLVVNRLMVKFNPGPISTLTVAGRRTKLPRKVPVTPLELDGTRYLVSPYGESEWVRNLRASGRAELSRKGRVETFQASEVPVDEREPIIAAYRRAVGRTVTPPFQGCQNPRTTRCSGSAEHKDSPGRHGCSYPLVRKPRHPAPAVCLACKSPLGHHK